MSESTSTEPTTTTDPGDSISEILEHLPPEVAQALGKSKRQEPATEEEESGDADQESEETEAEAETGDDESAEEAEDEESKDEDKEEEEEAKPRGIEKLEKRIDKLTRKRREAEAEAETLREENARLKAEVDQRSAIKLEPTPEDPLADIESADELEAKVSAAKKVRAWALSNPDGATITQPDGTERYVDRAEMARYIAQTDALLTDHAPTRREYLRERQSILTESRTTYPDLFKPGTQAHSILLDTLKKVPALKKLPNFEMIVGDAIAGMQARMSATAKSADAKTKATAPAKKIAPAVPKPSTSRPPSTSSKSKNAQLDRVIRGGGIDDLANYFASA